MHFRSVLSGTLALLLVSGFAATASGTGQPADSGFSFHLPTLGIFGKKEKPEQQQIAQQQDGTTAAGLEDQLRQMNGKIEELNFQILQMQEQMRKQQEDNEFRFQQLEGGSQAGSHRHRRNRRPRRRTVAPAPASPRPRQTRRRPMPARSRMAARASARSSSNRRPAIPAR